RSILAGLTAVHFHSFPSQTPIRRGLSSTAQTVERKEFSMSENQGRATEISRRETEKMRAELIVNEMASAVRVLGGEGSALAQNNAAARASRLPHTVIERLRWKKIKRVP